MSFRIHMVTPRQSDIAGAYGYSTLINRIYDGLIDNRVIFDRDSPVAFHVDPAARFDPVLGKFNILFTMFEAPTIPEQVLGSISAADMVIVPCEWNVPMHKQYVRPETPVVICNLGIDPRMYKPERRSWPARPGHSFQWLWVGAPNTRKGFDVIQDTWRYFRWNERDDCHLYIKTTGANLDTRYKSVQEGFEPGPERDVYICETRRIILDFRDLPTEKLAEVYHDSQGFLFPTGGEGWGLTLHEAMATGLPAIATNYGGHLDFIQDCDSVDLLPWTEYMCDVMTGGKLSHGKTWKGIKISTALVSPADLTVAMEKMMKNYRRVAIEARRDADKVRNFTWDQMGRNLTELLRQYVGRSRVAA
jgi:glycosyltransferase involved in cell wall biosynthesis